MLSKVLIAASILSATVARPDAQASDMQSPEEYLGFRVGADRKLADYTEVMGYFEQLAEASPWVEVREIGKSTLGRPFIMAVISTPGNLENLDAYIDISRKLSDPRNISETEALDLIDRGRALVMITCNLHSTEIGSSQMAMELAYDIAAQRNETIITALEETVLFLIPSLNPDGLQMVVDWYEKWVGTEYEGCRMPWLYHHYAGHDNNRDWYMVSLDETRAVFDLYFRKVVPHVILDMHQMWSTGARLFVPPFYPPANTNVDPMIHRMVGLIGYYMQLECEERDYKGVVSDAYFTAYWEGTSMMTPWWHNQVGLLSEMASANIASPVFIEEGELRGGSKGLPRYEHRINFPNPWPGGWWRLRDIVDYELAISDGLMDFCASHRKKLLRNFYIMGARAVDRGMKESPYGFVFPAPFRDPGTTARLVEALMLGGVEVHRAREDFILGERLYRAGSFVVRCDQPYRAYAKDLLEVQDYPDIRASDKEPYIRPYDVTGWTLPLQMGVRCEQITEPFDIDLELLSDFPYPEVRSPEPTAWGYILLPERNSSYSAVNILLGDGVRIFRVCGDCSAGDTAVPAGSFLIQTGKSFERSAPALARDRHIEFIKIDEKPDDRFLSKLRPVKTALFKPWRASMDEGWTRLLFDDAGVPYDNVMNEDISKGVISGYDALILPDISPSVIKEGKITGAMAASYRPLPPEYSGGIGMEGAERIKEFVEDGGTLICFNSSCEFAIETFELPIRNVLSGVSGDDFYCPGTILEVSFKTGHPVTYGMDPEGYIFFKKGPAFSTSIPFGKFGRTVLASYKKKDPRASGLLIGAEKLHRSSPLVEMTYGKGRILLFGFRPQHRCQTHGTYKLIYNALLASVSG